MSVRSPFRVPAPRGVPAASWRRALEVAAIGLSALLLACSSSTSAATEEIARLDPEGEPAPALEDRAAAAPPYLLWNQLLIEGYASEGAELTDVDAMFAQVFAALPDAVTVYPSENYYYFILNQGGRQVWGNIRLPAGDRDEGLLSFGYFEFIEFPTLFAGERTTGHRFYGADDDVFVKRQDRFTYDVRVGDKTVVFNLHQLDQTTPASLPLADSERFIQRTLDESGHHFYLIFDDAREHFLWVLNEEEDVPDQLDPFTDDVRIGRRSGFAFWSDPLGRTVLVGVRQLNVKRNDYFDGPFDQLADNYADETDISEYMQRAYPGLRDRIDRFGYYLDRDPPLRVGLTNYFVYSTLGQLRTFMDEVRADPEPYLRISRGARGASD